MTRLIYSKETNRQNLRSDAASPQEADEILHLKRLIVTLKQHYEKSIQALQIQLQAEQNQKVETQKELDSWRVREQESQKLHEEELLALGSQQIALKELLKKTQEELKQVKESKDISLETVVSTTSSHHLRQELESIKRTLAQDTNSLETRYMDLLNEKVALENQCKQYQQQLEHQSTNLTSFQQKLHQVDENKRKLEETIHAKELELSENAHRIEEMAARMIDLENRAKEKDFVQDKYEQLKDEWNELGERLEEAAEIRAQAEEHLVLLQENCIKQEGQITDLLQQLQELQEELKNAQTDRDQLKILLDESETRLKVAQQHLAKKVKESALLSERVEEQQNSLGEMSQLMDQQKTQIVQLQASVDLYQRQEKRLQDQLHDALKGTESQAAKWEEKYFRMYDKWQESENKIRELRKFEEKHLQMQHLLSNLGNFMGSSFNNAPASADEGLSSPSSQLPDERIDLFGMRQP